MEQKETRYIISGRVQMVMFRDFATRKGRKLGLTGYAKNLADGTVEVVAQGPQDKLEQFLEYLKKGSLLSRVDTVDVEGLTVEKLYSNFSIVW